MSAIDHGPLNLADVAGSFDEHNGVRLTRVGEDGDVLILGHHDDETCWAAYEEFSGDHEGPIWLDLRQTQVAWNTHSEGCEKVDCRCGDDRCDPCQAGTHDDCADPGDCDCADWEHDAACRCECYCDEYAWWVSDVTANGEPATWVSFSFEKARKRREELHNRAVRPDGPVR